MLLYIKLYWYLVVYVVNLLKVFPGLVQYTILWGSPADYSEYFNYILKDRDRKLFIKLRAIKFKAIKQCR